MNSWQPYSNTSNQKMINKVIFVIIIFTIELTCQFVIASATIYCHSTIYLDE